METKIDPREIKKIEKLTGGKIGTHTFGPNQEHTLENSFLSPDGTYIGDFERAQWYVEQKLMIDEEYPHGVAAVIKDETYGTDNPEIEGMYGYTHRGGQMFRIGDRLFDGNYKPQKEDYSEEEWSKYEESFKKSYDEAEDLDKKWMNEDGISYVIPFKMRGRKKIETMREAFEAARNMSKYLS